MGCVAQNEVALGTALCGCGWFGADRATLDNLLTVQDTCIIPFGYFALNIGNGGEHFGFHNVGCVELCRMVFGVERSR